jgi:protein disulfide-isomerase
MMPPNAPPANMLSNTPPVLGQPANVPQGNAASPSSANPPLALDGYCPVSLVEKHKWVPGDKRYGANHLGRVYLFAGPEEQSKFFANANFDRYAPVASGVDVVMAAEEHKMVPGKREHGVFFKDRIFLFANEASVQKFYTNPFFYMGQALGAPLQASANGQQPR